MDDKASLKRRVVRSREPFLIFEATSDISGTVEAKVSDLAHRLCQVLTFG